jgi:hypothetical protein
VTTSVEGTPNQAPPGSWAPVSGRPPRRLSDAEVIAFAIAACESLLLDQSFGPLTRLIDVRRDVPPEVRDGEEADYKSAVFTVTSCLAHTVGLRPLPRDLEVLLRQGMAVYPGHRPSPDLLANEMRRAAMRLSIAVPDSLRPSAAGAAFIPLAEPTLAPDSQPPPAAPPTATPAPSKGPTTAPPRAPGPEPAPISAPEEVSGRSRRWFFALVLGVALAAGALSYTADRILNGSSDDKPVTSTTATGAKGAPRTTSAAGATGAEAAGSTGGSKGAAPAKGVVAAERVDLRVGRIAVQAGPNGQTQVKIAPTIDSKLPRAMTLPFGPGARLMLLTDPLSAAWQPSVAPRGHPVQLRVDASTLGSPRSGSVTAIPPNPVSSPATFTGGDGAQHQTMVSTMKDRELAAGVTMPNRDEGDGVVYDVPLGTSVLGLALVGDDGSVIAMTPRSAMPEASAASF